MSANEPNADIGKLVTAGRPDVGEDEGKLGAKTPSVLAKTEGNQENARQLHLSNPVDFPELFAADLPLEQAQFAPRVSDPTLSVSA